MKILLVEDDPIKKELVENFLIAKNIKVVSFSSINPALRYIINAKKKISGIILDLGLASEDDATDYDYVRGLDLVKELTRKNIKIPILINSTTHINLPYIKKHYKNVKGQTSVIDHGDRLINKFITYLSKTKKQ